MIIDIEIYLWRKVVLGESNERAKDLADLSYLYPQEGMHVSDTRELQEPRQALRDDARQHDPDVCLTKTSALPQDVPRSETPTRS